jgi:internalin A
MSYEIAQQRIADARDRGSVRLNLSGLSLTELPAELWTLTRLRVLWLSRNQLTSLPPEVGALVNLERLRLTRNRLAALPPELGALSPLRELRLEDNQLAVLPAALWQLTQLRVLRLDSNNLTDLPPAIAQLQELRTLSLGRYSEREGESWYRSETRNQLRAVPVELSQLSQLQYLGLDNNQLTAVPVELSQLSQLQSLVLSNNQLTQVPVELSQLSQLQRLWLSDNQLTAVPVELSQLSQLQRLWLSDNQLTAVPVELSQLSQLQYLGLDNNQLTQVPVELSQLSQLQRLNLSNNQLTAVPVELSQLSQLQELWLSKNQLTQVPVELSQLSQLQSLGLDNNQLTAVPVELSQLSQLQTLNLDDNQLTAVPAELSQLSQLENVWLDNNQLTQVPVELSQLSQLQWLDLNNNQLTEVPMELGQLSQLQRLGLSDNQLTQVPVELSQLSQLQYLGLSGNPDLKIPPEVEADGTRALLDFLSQAPQPHWVAKLMLVGEGRVGKSSLLRALLGLPFELNLPTTHGMLIGRLPLPHPRRAGVEMELSTWDFGGQQIYHAMHQFFLTDRALYVLVWDGQRRFEECKVRDWLEALALRVPDAPVLLVATHVPRGGRPADLPFGQLTEAYPHLVPVHFEVDNETGDGIADLRDKLIETAAKLGLMGELSPPAWLAVKADIRARRENQKCCTPAQLEDLMSAHGITAQTSQQRLARFLHELGEIIQYPDNPALRDTVILDPEWVSQTISLVLDSDEVLRGLGYFRRDLMDKVWRRLDRGMREHMLGLMEEFDLSYRTMDEREISIVVERLSHEPPTDWDKEWNHVPTPCREIKIEFKLSTALPPGIPTWFIARQHRYTRNTHWKRGAVFADDRRNPKHWALIEAYPEDKFLRLVVRGPAPHEFFSQMRRGLWETFNRYEGLREGKYRVVETVPCPGKRNDQPCTNEFEVTDLSGLMTDENPILTYPCIRCRTNVSIPELLLGIRFEPTYNKLVELSDTVQQQFDRAAEKLDVVHADVQEVRGLIRLLQGEYATLFNAFQHIEEMQSPYVFVLRGGVYEGDLQGLFGGTGLRGGAFRELSDRLWKRKMELQLYCQMPGCWHPLGYERGKDDPATGLYQVEINADLLQAIAPHLPKMAKLLKYARPFVSAALAISGLPGVAPDAKRLTQLKDDYEQMLKLAEKVPSLEEITAARLARGLPEASSATEAGGAMLRGLRRLLEEKDKDRVWGKLKRRYDKSQGHHLWLCPEHFDEYEV